MAPAPPNKDAGGPGAPSPGRKSYGQILKSSALVGGSAVVNVGVGMLRTKVMAVLLGPAGYGLFGLFNSIADLVRTLAGMGINSSGVRQIADAVGTGNRERIARTIATLRRVAFVLGALGGLILVIFAKPIWLMSFNARQRAAGLVGPGSVALLGLVVFFGAVCSGQIALLQGMRRIADYARANVLGAVLGSTLSIVVVFYFSWRGEARDGVVPALICVGAMGMLASWWFSRQIKVERVPMSLADLSGEASALLKLGFVFMASALMTQAVAYLVRLLVMRKLGEDAAGYYQSAYVFAGQYVGFILQAMGADFYPRLTAVARDNRECNRMVNEQAEVGLLLAGPGVLATLTFAPWVMLTFYSSKFGPAVEILRWICLGMILRVVSWPMGFILLAKGARQPFFWSELTTSLVQVGLVWLLLLNRGLEGTGMAFFGSYAFYWVLIYVIVRSVSGFRWSAANKGLGLLFSTLAAGVFIAWYWLPRPTVVIGGAIITLLAGIYSMRKLCTLVSLERLPKPLRRLLVLFRFTKG